MPTVVMPGSRASRIAETVASSTSATSRGVPSIGTSPDFRAAAVSASSTFSSIDAASPGSTGTPVRYDDDRRIPGSPRPGHRAAHRRGLRRGVPRRPPPQPPPARQWSPPYADTPRRILVANSDGLLASDDTVRTRVGINAVAVGDTGMQTGYEAPGRSIGFELFDEIDIDEVARKASRRALDML